MTTHRGLQPLIIQDENLGIHLKKNGTDGTTKSTKPASKKGQVLGGRKALNDITNKSSLPPSVSTKKKSAAKQDFNIADEKFLHDHTKCIEENQKVTESSFWETIFPRHDTLSAVVFADTIPAEIEPDTSCCYPEPLELPMSEFEDWLQPSLNLDCTTLSPIDWESPPPSPFRWESESVEFALKEVMDY